MDQSPSVAGRKWRLLAWLLVPATAFVGLLAFAILETGGVPAPGDPAPAFDAPLLRGDGTLALADLRGKPAVINFWASWCIPCRDEAPLLRRAHEEYGDRVSIVGIDIKDARSDALDFIDRYGIDYLHVRDEDLDIYDEYGLTGQPETFFVDSEGIIVEHVPGPLTEDQLFGLLDVLVSRDA
ncbi:MAG: TlpA family protein disulfide reductase [Actinomycetota bacterium]